MSYNNRILKYITWILVFMIILGAMPLEVLANNDFDTNYHKQEYYKIPKIMDRMPVGTKILDNLVAYQRANQGSHEEEADFENEEQPEEEDSYIYGMLAIPIDGLMGLNEDDTYTWDGDATNDNLEGVTKIILTPTASGTLKLTESNLAGSVVTIEVDGELSFDEERYIQADFSVGEIQFTGENNAIISGLEFSGISLTLNAETFLQPGIIEITNDDASLEWKGDGGISAGTLIGNLGKFKATNYGTIYDGIEGSVDTIEIDGNTLTVMTQSSNTDDTEPFKTVIPSVRNIFVKNGSLNIYGGNNNGTNQQAGHGLVLEAGGQIRIENGTLDASGSCGEYYSNNGGIGLKTLGTANIYVSGSNSKLKLSGQEKGGNALYAGGDIKLTLEDGAYTYFSGNAGGVDDVTHTIDGTGDLELFLRYGSTAVFTSGAYMEAIGKDITVNFMAVGDGASSEYTKSAPTLIAKNGTYFTGEASDINIVRHVPGEFKYNDGSEGSYDAEYTIEGEITATSFKIKPSGVANNGEFWLAPDATAPLYIYCGEDKETPNRGVVFTIDGIEITTDASGYAQLPALTDGTYTTTPSAILAVFDITIEGGKITSTSASLPQGVDVINKGYGLQILTAAPDYLEFSSAEQVNGRSGMKDTEGILLKFDKTISLPKERISITYGDNKKIAVDYIRSEQGGWYIPFDSLPADLGNDTKVTVSIGNWESNVVQPNSHEVTIYRRGIERTFGLIQVGGKDGLIDTTGILVTFEVVDTVLTENQIVLTGATLDSLTDNGDSDGKTWLINIKDITVGNNNNVTVQIKDAETYPIRQTPWPVMVHQGIDTDLTYTAIPNGQDGLEKTTEILLTFNENVDGLVEDKITLTGATLTELTDNGDDDPKTYLLKIQGEYENGAEIGITIGTWTGASTYYKVKTNESVIVFNDARVGVTFTAEQIDGTPTGLRTRTIRIIFNEDVKHLTRNRIKAKGAYVSSLKEITPTTWEASISGINVKNKENIKVSIESWPGYRVENDPKEVDVQVFTANAIGYSATQVGGSSKTGLTTGILLKFAEGLPVPLALDEVKLTYKNNPSNVYDSKIDLPIKSITDNGDQDASTWLLEIEGDWKDNATAAVVVGKNGQAGGRHVYNYSSPISTRLYKDYQTYLHYTVEQFGEDGMKNTEYLLLKFYEDSDGSPGEVTYTTLKTGDIEVEGAIVGTISRSSMDSHKIYLYKDSYENGDEIKITIDNIDNIEGAVIVNPTKSIQVYKNLRTFAYISSGSGNGQSGMTDTNMITIRMNRDIPELTLDHVTVEGATKKSLTQIPDNKQYWRVEVADVVANDSTIKVDIIAPQGYEIPPNNWRNIPGYKDLRTHIELVEISQYGGQNGVKDSQGLSLVFSEDIDIGDFRVRNYESIQGKLIDDGDGDNKTHKFEFSPSTLYRFSNNQSVYFHVNSNNRDIAIDNGTYRKANIYKFSREFDASRNIDIVSPRAVHVENKEKIITLIGYFGTNGPRDVNALIFRDAKDRQKLETLSYPRLISSTVSTKDKRDSMTINVGSVNMLKNLGSYEIAYRSKDGFESAFAPLTVVDDPAYSSEAYGIVAITQLSNRQFEIEAFSNESEMNAKKSKGTTLLTFRGGALQNNSNYYHVRGDSTMNKVLEYVADTEEYITISKGANGNVSIFAKKGSLRWNNITIAKDFEIELKTNTRYKNQRLSNGSDVLMTTNAMGYMDFLAIQTELKEFRIYEQEFSLGGSIMLGGAIPILGDSLSAGVELQEAILREGLRQFPPMHVEASVGFSPGGLLGDFIGASGEMEFEMNTLPETSPKYVGVSGELSINDVFYVDGAFVFTWGEKNGKMLFIPDEIRFFFRLDGEGMGIPLVPPVTLAYITGAGGGVKGLAQTVHGNYSSIPPFQLSLSGAVKDVTGAIINVEKATLTLGPSEFSLRANSVKVLEVVNLLDVGISMGLRDGKDSPLPDAYFNFGGRLEIDLFLAQLSASLDVWAELYGKYMGQAIVGYMKQVQNSKNKFQLPNKQVKDALYNSFDIGITAKARGEVNLGLAKLRGSGELIGDKTQISGMVEGAIIPFWGSEYGGSAGVTYYFKNDRVKIDFGKSRMAALPEDEFVIAEGSNGEKLIATNVKALGSFGPSLAPASSDSGGQMMRMMTSSLQYTTEVPGMEEGNLVGIMANEKYTTITIHRDGELVVTEEIAEDKWQDTVEEYENLGKYTGVYIIPEGGNYTFSAAGPLHCEVIRFSPIPELTDVSIDATTNTASWSVNDTAMEKIDDLYINLTLHDAETGKMAQTLSITDETYTVWIDDGQEITLPVTKIDADKYSFVYTLSDTLPTGNYFVKTSLMEVKKGEYINLHTMDSLEFDFVNNQAPEKVEGVKVEYVGDAAFEVSWDEVSGADGYLITLLNEDGSPVENLTTINVGKDEKEFIIQAGMAVLETEEGLDEDGNPIESKNIEVGLEFGKAYKVSVKAYKNKVLEYEGLDPHNIPIYGEAGIADFTIAEPIIPQITLSVEGANKIATDDTTTFAINNNKPSIIVSVDRSVTEIKVYKVNGEEELIKTISGSSATFQAEFPEDGIYYLRFDTELGVEKVSQTIAISIDTKAPYLTVDGESRRARNGNIIVNGMTENGASLFIDGEEFQSGGGSFTIEATTDNILTPMHLMAQDDAGNTAELYLEIINEDNGGSDSGRSDRNVPAENDKETEITTIRGLKFEISDDEKTTNNEDGTITLPRATLILDQGTKLNLPAGTILGPDNSIHIPKDETCEAILVSGIVLTIRGGTILMPDESQPLGYSVIGEGRFQDVKAGSWYEDAIGFAYAHNLFAGTGENIFSPDLAMTRGMLVTVLGRLAGVDTSKFTKSAFNDVDEDKYYSSYIEWAKEAGIVSGIGNNEFAPDREISREDLAVILFRYISRSSSTLELSKSREYEGFKDKDSISTYAKEAVEACYMAKIISGKPGDIFDPKGDATRAEVATMLFRFIFNVK